MTRYKIFRFDGNTSKYITSVDDEKENIKEKLKELNKTVPTEELVRGYGYYSEKQKEY